MLRITEKEDFDARTREVEAVVVKWREVVANVPPAVEQEFLSKLLISLIYHDAALEGEVLSHSEIKAATDTSIISDSSLIPAYEDITNYNAAVTVALQLGQQDNKVPVGLELIRQIYGILAPSAKGDGFAYRSDNPLHRLYYHSIAEPAAIASSMKKLDKWLCSPEYAGLGAIEKAAEAHFRLMAVFPWADQSGRLSRIISIMILRQEDYPVPVIHSIDRQAYYEALRSTDTRALISLYLEAVETTATSSMRVYEEAAAYRGGRPARAS